MLPGGVQTIQIGRNLSQTNETCLKSIFVNFESISPSHLTSLLIKLQKIKQLDI